MFCKYNGLEVYVRMFEYKRSKIYSVSTSYEKKMIFGNHVWKNSESVVSNKKWTGKFKTTKAFVWTSIKTLTFMFMGKDQVTKQTCMFKNKWPEF